jgi:hypothetical protein
MAVQQFPVPESGIPKGATGARPGAPTVGTVFYNGTTTILEIWDGDSWVPCSAVAAQPTISVADVGTGVAYTGAQATVTFTPGSIGGNAIGYTTSSSTGGYSATTTGTTATITVGNPGSWTLSGTAYNGYGISPVTPSTTITLTTNPEAASNVVPTISGVDIAVTWTLGATGGKNLSAVSVVPFLNGTTEQTATSVSTSATTATITGLTAGSSYTFKVRKTNANGTTDSTASASITTPITINYLVVAGGGGGARSGGNNAETGGGGGAGGMVTGTTGLAFATTTTVTVGAGGGDRAAGSNSQFGTITASVGGGQGGMAFVAGSSGGSGGGGGSPSFAGGSGTAGQGNTGGTGVSNLGGGGGGKNAAASGATGGAGLASSITGSSVTYATGGTSNGTQAAATANTGNGGSGGIGSNSPIVFGWTGGSGIVVISYPDTIAAATTTTGSPTITTSGGNRIYKWTGSGSITL